jgi:hypothetical protein
VGDVGATLAVARLSPWASRCFAALSMTGLSSCRKLSTANGWPSKQSKLKPLSGAILSKEMLSINLLVLRIRIQWPYMEVFYLPS